MQGVPSQERERRILALWEQAAGTDRFVRDDTLLAAVGVTSPALGARNAALLALRTELFGRAWSLVSRCPRCLADCEFATDSQALAASLQSAPVEAHRSTIDIGGRSILVRPPDIDDLRAAAQQPDSAGALRCLVSRCASTDAARQLEADWVETIGARLEQLDPAAVVSFALACPACDNDWSAIIDIGDALWLELQRAAETILLDVDTLARSYGWTEREVLDLSPVRRAAYLQLAAGP